MLENALLCRLGRRRRSCRVQGPAARFRRTRVAWESSVASNNCFPLARAFARIIRLFIGFWRRGFWRDKRQTVSPIN